VKHPNLLLLCWVLLAVMVLAVDYLTGPNIRFPILYLLPIVLSAWLNGLGWSLGFAVGLPLVQLSLSKFWGTWYTPLYGAVNTLIRIAVFVGFAYLIHKVGLQKRELEKEVRTLRGILPICSFCKRIRNQEGSWESLEGYITMRSEAEFSHGLCPECAKKNYPEIYKG
jgi:hypothetical protein